MYSAVMDAKGIKREIQYHFLCKLETMIANTVLVGFQGISYDQMFPALV